MAHGDEMTWNGANWREMECGACGIRFLVPQSFDNNKREHGLGWHCPNGHSRIYRESDSEKMRRERDLARQQVARAEQEAAEAREAQAKAERREKRIRKRIHAGVCPCCNRTFVNLGRHMQTKHPDQLGPNIVKLGKAS